MWKLDFKRTCDWLGHVLRIFGHTCLRSWNLNLNDGRLTIYATSFILSGLQGEISARFSLRFVHLFALLLRDWRLRVLHKKWLSLLLETFVYQLLQIWVNLRFSIFFVDRRWFSVVFARNLRSLEGRSFKGCRVFVFLVLRLWVQVLILVEVGFVERLRTKHSACNFGGLDLVTLRRREVIQRVCQSWIVQFLLLLSLEETGSDSATPVTLNTRTILLLLSLLFERRIQVFDDSLLVLLVWNFVPIVWRLLISMIVVLLGFRQGLTLEQSWLSKEIIARLALLLANLICIAFSFLLVDIVILVNVVFFLGSTLEWKFVWFEESLRIWTFLNFDVIFNFGQQKMISSQFDQLLIFVGVWSWFGRREFVSIHIDSVATNHAPIRRANQIMRLLLLISKLFIFFVAVK